MFNFNTIYGTPLIYVLVFGATATKFALDLGSSHPKLQDRPLICWDLVVLSMPAMLAGKILGLMANIIFPEWLIILIFVAVMVNDFTGTLSYYTELTAPAKVGAPDADCASISPEKQSDTIPRTHSARVLAAGTEQAEPVKEEQVKVNDGYSQ